MRRTPRMGDRIKAWPEDILLVVVGPDVQGEGGAWKNVLDPDNNVGFVPTRYLAIVSGGDPERVAQIAGEQLERWAWETAERAVREAVRENVGDAPAGWIDWLIGKVWGAKPAPTTAGKPLRVAVLLPGIGAELDASTNGKDNPSLGQAYEFLCVHGHEIECGSLVKSRKLRCRQWQWSVGSRSMDSHRVLLRRTKREVLP